MLRLALDLPVDAAHVLANGVDALERVLADLAGVRPSVGAIREWSD